VNWDGKDMSDDVQKDTVERREKKLVPLRVLRESKKRRTPNPSALPWRRARQITQIIALFVFLVLLIVTRGGQFPSAPPSLFFRLDPLAMLASVIAGRRWVTGLGLALVTLGLTLVAGRVWCGWLCPLGTTLDLIRPRKRSRPATSVTWQKGSQWRTIKYIALIAVLGAALAGNLTLLMFDPISVLTRGLASFVLPGLNQATMSLERVLYNIPPLQGALDWFDISVRTSLFSTDVWRWWNLVPGLLLVGVVALNWLAERFWCRYLCPLGGLLGLVSRVAILRRVVGVDACRHCQRCTRVCPTGTIDMASFESDPAECTVCLNCLLECPTPNGQTFAPVWKLALAQGYDPSRRQMLAALGAGFVAAVAYPLVPVSLRRDSHLIRPPGAQSGAFLSECIRCGECLKVCPTSGLQPALWESGLDGVWTPTLVPRLGYCDYACHACGQVCPTGAIPNLSLEEKRKQVIGKAEINRDRCLPWAKNTPCIVCEEMCPLAPKAVELDTFYVTDEAGQPMTIQRPHVIKERCIGCGICEFKCPAVGEAAIRVGREM
jgi:polyferredoxin